ncbi:MAG: hypothetical protein ACR2FF_07495 [Mycobacteriales bacterium]
MSDAWKLGFIVLATAVGVLAFLILGFLRRTQDALDRIESASGQVSVEPSAAFAEGSRAPRLEQVANAPIQGRLPSSREYLMAFLSPECEPCERILQELRDVGWLRELPVLIVALKDTMREYDHGLPEPIVVAVDHDSSMATAFGSSLTPAAILVDANSQIARVSIPANVGDLRLMAESSDARNGNAISW